MKVNLHLLLACLFACKPVCCAPSYSLAWRREIALRPFSMATSVPPLAASGPSTTWRSCVFSLETDKDEESNALFAEVIAFVRGGQGSGGALTPRQKGRYMFLSKDDLAVFAKERGVKSLAQALQVFMKQDRVEGEMKKYNAALREKTQAEESNEPPTSEKLGSTSSNAAAAVAATAAAAADSDDDDPDAMDKLAKRQAEDEKKMLAAQENFDSAASALDEVAEAPDRIYILSNYPSSLGEVEEMIAVGEDNKKDGGSILDGIVTIVNSKGQELNPRGPGSLEFVKNPPNLERPRTAFDVHSKTSVTFATDAEIGARPDTAPHDPGKKHKEREEKKYYQPTHGLGLEVKKAIPSKSKAWQDLTLEVISCGVPASGKAEAKEEEAKEAQSSAASQDTPYKKITPAEFIKKFNSHIADISIDKVMFKSYVNTMVPIPEIDLSSTNKAMKTAADAPYSTTTSQATWREKGTDQVCL